MTPYVIIILLIYIIASYMRCPVHLKAVVADDLHNVQKHHLL